MAIGDMWPGLQRSSLIAKQDTAVFATLYVGPLPMILQQTQIVAHEMGSLITQFASQGPNYSTATDVLA